MCSEVNTFYNNYTLSTSVIPFHIINNQFNNGTLSVRVYTVFSFFVFKFANEKRIPFSFFVRKFEKEKGKNGIYGPLSRAYLLLINYYNEVLNTGK